MARHKRPEGWIHDWQPDHPNTGASHTPPHTAKSSSNQSSVRTSNSEANQPGSNESRANRPGANSDGVASGKDGFGSVRDDDFTNASSGSYDTPRGSYSQASESFTPASEDLITPEESLDRQSSFTKKVASVPGRLLIRMSLLATGVLIVLALIGLFALHSGGYVVPLVLGIAILAVTLFFAWRRHQLHLALAASGPRTVVSGQRGLQTYDPSDASNQSELHATMEREGEKIRRAREEFQTRSARYLPRVEALQRAMRQMVDPSYDAAWLDVDIRPLLVSFFATALLLPFTGFLVILTAFALLLSSI